MSERLVTIVSATARMGRRALGFGLVLASLSGPAWAQCPPTCQAPEIDPGSMVSAMTLLTGGLLLLIDRRRQA